ncbi:MAG: ABC transporter ATP-binding protein [Planctomycetota bacterium]
MVRSASSRQRYAAYRQRKRQQRDDPVPRDTKGRPIQRSRGFAALLSAFWGLLRGHRLILGLACVSLTLSTLIALVPLYAPKLVVDSVLGDVPPPEWLTNLLPASGSDAEIKRTLLFAVVAVALLLTVVSVLVGLWGRWHATRIGKRLQSDVRKRAFAQAARLPLPRVYALKSGGVAGVLRDDAGAVGGLVFGMVYNPLRAVIQFAGTLFILATIDGRLLLGGACILPVVWLTHRTWIARIRPMFRDVRRTREVIDGHATEVFGGMRVVRAFGRQRAEAGRFVAGNHTMIRQELHTWWWMRGVDTAWALIIPVASAGLLLYGALRILADRAAVADGLLDPAAALTIGDLVVFLGYLAALLGPVAQLAATATTLQNDLAALDRTLDLLDEPREMPPPADAVRLAPADVAGRVVLDRVSFRYPGSETDVLRDISLEAEPGQTVALVGPSGAGKSTLCNLVARFYDPTAGRVTLDGTDLRRFDVEAYRRTLGVVEQDVFLFDGTVADNIAYAISPGHPAAADPRTLRAAVEDAAQRAHAAEFIERFGLGYDTVVGERGVRLSGGQRQRLAIARAVLADPRILILDEATSSLDTHSERLIQASLQELMRGRTCFVIAHRLSTITPADQILVLSRGRVLERGTHDQLMAAHGTYRGMIEAQLTPDGVGV